MWKPGSKPSSIIPLREGRISSPLRKGLEPCYYFCWFWPSHTMLPAGSSCKTSQSSVTAALARIAMPGQSRPGRKNGSKSNNWQKHLLPKPGNFCLVHYDRGGFTQDFCPIPQSILSTKLQSHADEEKLCIWYRVHCPRSTSRTFVKSLVAA